MAGEALFFASQLLQAARCRSCLDVLEPGPQSTMAKPDGLQLRTGVPLSVRIGSDVADAKVNTQEVGRLYRSRVGDIDSAVQVELPFAVNQISLSFDAVKALLLILAINQRDYNTTFGERPQTDFIETLEAEDSLVIGDGPVGLEGRADLFAPVEALNSLTDGAHGHLGGQAESISDCPIRDLVDARLAEHPSVESALSRKGCGFIYTLHGLQEPRGLRGVWQNSQLERQFHYNGVYTSINQDSKRAQATDAVAALSLRMAEASGFPREGVL